MTTSPQNRFRRSALAAAGVLTLALAACADSGQVTPQNTSAEVRSTEKAADRPLAQSAEEVEVADGFEISGTTATWTDATLDTSTQTNPRVVPVPGAQPRTAEVSGDVEFFVPGGQPEVDDEGLGTRPATQDEFLTGTDNFAPKLYLDDDGELVKVASRYRP